ncbi:MAG: magnesium/cobalt transporter CorA [Planctomycetes bacterium]|nr:magnesium/cobalt transporter CorA [Planctomycetota bacterium]
MEPSLDPDEELAEDDAGPSPQTLAVGKAPGTLQIPADASPTQISVIRYGVDRSDRHDDVRADALQRLIDGDFRVVWIDVTGAGSQATFETLIQTFSLPWLAMEDHLNAPQRPKVEPYGDARFILLRAIQVPGTVEMDQISIFLSGHVVFTFQHHAGDCFDTLRKRIATAGSQLRQRGSDYLAYRIADAMVDSFFPEIERLMTSLEQLEGSAIERPNAKLLRNLHELKSQIRMLERTILPTRDAIGSLTRDDLVFAADTRPYLRDVHDHTQQLVEQIHLLSGLATDCGELVLGALDIKLNSVMKVLAAVTFVFMPLSFVTGLYGMNFKYMPELEWTFGYPLVLLGLGAAVVSMLLWLRRRGWTQMDD